jgi:hypothetical protein
MAYLGSILPFFALKIALKLVGWTLSTIFHKHFNPIKLAIILIPAGNAHPMKNGNFT